MSTAHSRQVALAFIRFMLHEDNTFNIELPRMNCVSATTACPRRCVFRVVWIRKAMSTVLAMLVINSSVTLGLRLQLVPRTEVF